MIKIIFGNARGLIEFIIIMIIIIMYQDHTHSTGINRVYDNNEVSSAVSVASIIFYKLYHNLLYFLLSFFLFKTSSVEWCTALYTMKQGNSDFQLKFKGNSELGSCENTESTSVYMYDLWTAFDLNCKPEFHDSCNSDSSLISTWNLPFLYLPSLSSSFPKFPS